jgi:hypothetical protein
MANSAAAAPEFPMALPQKDIDVVEQIFWTPGKGARESVRWSHFESTMTKIGAQVTQNGGKRVRFTIQGLGSADVHHPPPQIVIYPRQLKEIEDNLASAFSWTRESFVPADG